MCGVWGVWGDIAFPGEEAVEADVPATIGGAPESCLLKELFDRCNTKDDDIESERAALDSRMRWKRVKAFVLRVASRTDEFSGFNRSFLESSSLRKADMFSSSA